MAFELLIVDDEQDNQDLLSKLLTQHFPDCRIRTAGSGAETFAHIQQQAPDLILLDVRLPDTDGFTICRRLKRDQATSHIPILMVSAIMVDADHRVWGLESGAEGYICKPYEPPELLAQINALLRMKKSEDRLRDQQDKLEQLLADRTGALWESEAKFQTLFENSPDAYFVEDYEGYVLDVNPAACRLHGYPREELIGKHCTELVPSNMVQEAKADFETLVAGDVHSIDSFSLRQDGRRVPVEIRSGPIQYDGRPALFLQVRDTTERYRAKARERELTARLARSERMESLGVLAGGVAHDLNNILGPIVAYPEIILEELDPDHPVRADIEQMGQSARRAAAVIQDLLTLARRGNYQTEPVNLNELVHTCLKTPGFNELQTHHPAVEVKTVCEPDLYPVQGSTPHLLQALTNLIMNAFEAMPDGGQLTISTQAAFVEHKVGTYEPIEEGQYMILNIADTGCGISRQNLEHIFEPFYTSKKLGRSGSGLGLAVVYGTMKDLKGHVDVQTAPGRGTVFSLYLPVAQKIARPQAEPDIDYRGTETVLVVDDVKQQREVAARLLSKMGYQVVCVSNGPDAIEQGWRHDIDIVLLDMILEDDFDGLETYKRLLELHPQLPCVIVSGFSETQRVREAQALGAGTYLRKPYTLEKLGRAIRQELDGRSRAAS